MEDTYTWINWSSEGTLDTTKKPSNADHPRTLQNQALERALQKAKPATGYPYDWEDHDLYEAGYPSTNPHSHSSVSTDETSNEDPNKTSNKGERS